MYLDHTIKLATINDYDKIESFNQGFKIPQRIKMSRKEINEKLIKEARKGNLLAVKSLLSQGADVHYQNSHGYTAFMKACEHCEYSTYLYLKKFISYEINLQNQNGETALMLASGGSGCESIVRDLFTHFSSTLNLSLTDVHGNNAYQRAKKEAREDIFATYDAFNNKNRKQNSRQSSIPVTLMKKVEKEESETLSCREKNAMILEFIQEKDTQTLETYLTNNIECLNQPVNILGTTLLMVASAQKGNRKTVELLIKQGAKLDKQDKEGMTALHLSIEEGAFQNMLLLLHSGANPNASSFRGFTPLMSALCSPKHSQLSKVLTLLLSHGANLHLKTVEGKSALDFAKEWGHEEIIKYLEKNL